MSVNGKPIMIGRNKQEELLALLIDRGESGLLKKDAVENLWNGYCSDSIYWTTMSRLKKILDEAGSISWRTLFAVSVGAGEKKAA